MSKNKAMDRQIGGGHYKHFAIQPMEFVQRNKVPPIEASVIKYVLRHNFKNGEEDILKSIHLLEVLLELEYSNDTISESKEELIDKISSMSDKIDKYVDEILRLKQELASIYRFKEADDE